METPEIHQFNVVRHDAPDAAAGPLVPVIGRWYHGQSVRGTGAMAKYNGYGEFVMGDGTVVDMTIYDYLVEHPPRAAT